MPDQVPPFLPDDLPDAPRHRRGGREVLWDPCRSALVVATPEEIIRQKFVQHLCINLGVPLDCLSVEDAMTHFIKGARGRADIIVWGPDDKPLFVVECKAPGIPLSDAVFGQALRYHEIVDGDSGLLGLTNGDETRWYSIDKSTGDGTELEHAPRYGDLIAGQLPKEIAPMKPPPRPHYLTPSVADYELFAEVGSLGLGSPQEHHGYLSNLIGLLYCCGDPEYDGRSGQFSIESTGIRFASFGNAAGGQWSGPYRYFVISDQAGDAQVVSLAILGKMLARNHPKFGNTSGTTMLIVAVDDFDKSHNSLQLDLDKFIEATPSTIRCWHNGTLTKGKQGRMKNLAVINYVREHAASLVVGATVELGTLPRTREIDWKDAEQFIYNCIEYALVRDALRRQP